MDNESTFLLRSDSVLRWDVAELVLAPTEAWEIVQGGNCGSPMETADGWLVLMHGVGPMRRYVLSAVLLRPGEPTKVIGRLPKPLLEPESWERDGYVPNVVYSCGGLIHDDVLVVPYGISNHGSRWRRPWHPTCSRRWFDFSLNRFPTALDVMASRPTWSHWRAFGRDNGRGANQPPLGDSVLCSPRDQDPTKSASRRFQLCDGQELVPRTPVWSSYLG